MVIQHCLQELAAPKSSHERFGQYIPKQGLPINPVDTVAYWCYTVNIMKEQVMSQITTADKKTKPRCEVGFKTDPKLDLEIREKLIPARIGPYSPPPVLRQSCSSNLNLLMLTVGALRRRQMARTFLQYKFVINLHLPKPFLFGHELHCVYDVWDVMMAPNPMLANVAADYCVNGDLVQNKVGNSNYCCSITCNITIGRSNVYMMT